MLLKNLCIYLYINISVYVSMFNIYVCIVYMASYQKCNSINNQHLNLGTIVDLRILHNHTREFDYLSPNQTSNF